MAINFSNAVKNERLQALCNVINASVTQLIIYDDLDATLCELPFANPCEASIISGILTFNSLSESMVLEDSSATKASIVDADENVLATMIVGDMDSGADLKLPSTTLYAGSLLRLNGWTITEL